MDYSKEANMSKRDRASGLKPLLLGWVLVLGYCLAVAVGPQLIVASEGRPAGTAILVASAAD
jgi:hypothetical protein